ncbi:Na-translocating system protein MpsC family protein [Peribacillus sp. SCS-37]|uniref:Na-translocating system protein MpsC family protein n=1 Tax=Paraperibacillus esterisolvens TaxID=3115296 RepID=UPI0039067333
MDIKEQQTKLANNFGKLLRDKFGKGPHSIHAVVASPFVLIYVRGFISPMEQILLDQDQEITVKTTREFLMKTIDPEIRGQIKGITDMDIQHIYYDWNLQKETGVFLAVNEVFNQQQLKDDYRGKEQIHEEIKLISEQAEKTPSAISSYLISPRALIITRAGILVPIEKQLVSLGFHETLRVAKRQLEGDMLSNNIHFSEILGAAILDTFVDWDFALDNSVIILMLKPNE